tara:strand:- start:496 stop:1194 length:699 start_codon:yes stop_codon:yes gene_type:complete
MNNINSVENKMFIWKLLLDNGSFNKLTNEQIQKIYNKYDSIVANVNEDNKQEPLVEKNKKLIYKINENINTLYNSSNISKQEPITAEEIITKRQEQFNNNLNTKRQEFDTLINYKKPEEIDFADKKEEPIKNINTVLSSVISDRENDLKIDYSTSNNQNTNKFITIGENIDLSNENINTITNNINPNNMHQNNNIINNLQIILDKISTIENVQNKILEQIIDLTQSIHKKKD